MKRQKTFKYIGVFFIVVIGLVMIYLVYNEDVSSYNDGGSSLEEEEDIGIDQEHTISHSQAHSQYEGLDIVTRIEDSKSFHKAIHYPTLAKDDLNQIILDYVSESEKEFDDQISYSHNEPSYDFQYYFYFNFEIIDDFEGIYTFVFQQSKFMGGANSQEHLRIFILDTDEMKFIDQESMINDSIEDKDKLYQILRSAFEESEYKDFYFDDSLKELLNEGRLFDWMYLTKDHMVFAFEEYLVAAGAAGIPMIELPIDDVSFILTKEWRDKLALADDDIKAVEPDDDEIEEQVEDEDVVLYDKVVVLTFDDGPHLDYTLRILSLLEAYEAKGTFFMLGSRVDFYPGVAKEVADQGHEIGNHTWNHKDLTKISQADIDKEISRTDEAIKEATGKHPDLLRPPYGAINDDLRQDLSLPVVLWTVDTLDWKTKDPNAVLEVVKENVKDGSIILLHDIYEETVDATELILEYLSNEGYQFVTVSELLYGE